MDTPIKKRPNCGHCNKRFALRIVFFGNSDGGRWVPLCALDAADVPDFYPIAPLAEWVAPAE